MRKLLVEQAKDRILNVCVPLLKPGHEKLLISCPPEDYLAFRKALKLPEVKRAIPQGIEVKLQAIPLTGKPIPKSIGTKPARTSRGKLCRYLKSMGL